MIKINKNLIKVAGIYKISCQHRYYIGSSKDIGQRLRGHLSKLRHNKHVAKYMQNCFNKYGEINFNIEILEIIEYEETLLRQRELFYINQYKPVFNSTTPIEYNHSLEMKNKISKTLKEKYQNGSIINPMTIKARKFYVFDVEGNMIENNITINNIINKYNISNRSVINNSIRKGKPFIKKNNIIITSNIDYNRVLNNWIKKVNGKTMKIYRINSDGNFHLLKRNKDRMLPKILNSDDYIYYSKREKCFYTFIGKINLCRDKQKCLLL
jgi:hypothetical protein